MIADAVLFGSTDTATERTSLLQSTCTPHRLSWQWDNRQGKGRNDVITFFLFVMAAEMSEEERNCPELLFLINTSTVNQLVI